MPNFQSKSTIIQMYFNICLQFAAFKLLHEIKIVTLGIFLLVK